MTDGFTTALRELVRGLVAEELDKLRAAAPATLLTTAEAAAHAQVAAATIRRWLREGRLPEHRAGREIRVARADLDQLLARGVRERRPANSEKTPEQRATERFG